MSDASSFYALLRYEEAALALRAAMRLGVVDRLGAGQFSIERWQAEFRFTKQGARNFLAILQVMGVIARTPAGLEVTDVARDCLADAVPTSRKPYLSMGSGSEVDGFIALLRGDSTTDALPLYSGEAAGASVMDLGDVAREIAIGLSSRARNFAHPLAESIARHASNGTRFADIGAGSPYVCHAVLAAIPSLEQVMLVDRPNGMQFARELAAELALRQQLDRRLVFREQDFFDPLPEADIYCLSNTAHDWLPEEYTRIVRNLKVPRRGATLCIHEPLMLDSWDDDAQWRQALWMACYAQTLFRLTLGQGTCYTLQEHDGMLAACGWNRVADPEGTCDGCTALFYKPNEFVG